MANLITLSHSRHLYKERLEVIVPVGKLSDLAWVDVGTAVVMIAMFFYLLVTSIRTARRLFSIPSMKTD